jgi:hypothetical protein
MFLRQLTAGQSLRAEVPGWETVVSIPQFKALFLVILKFIYGVVDIEPTFWFIFSLVVLFAAIVVAWQQYPNKLEYAFRLFLKKIHLIRRNLLGIKSSRPSLLLLFFIPLIIVWLVSFFVPVIRPKRVLYLLPFFYLLISAPLANKKVPQQIALAPVALLLIINLYGVWQYWTQPQLQRENWRALKNEVIELLPEKETIALFSFNEPFAPWRWYQPKAMASLSTGERHIDRVEDLSNTFKPINDYQYVLVFDYLRDLTDPNDRLLEVVENYGFEGRGVIDYPNLGFVRIYSRPENALGYTP